jgi:hypothetical protein
VVSWPGTWGWLVVERKGAVEPMVGWKGIHPQSIGKLKFALKQISVSKCIYKIFVNKHKFSFFLKEVLIC